MSGKHCVFVLGVVACAASLLGCPRGLEERFTVSIARDFDTQEEENLLAVAEAAYPPREDVAALAEANGTDPTTLPLEGYWWYDTLDEVSIPYAATGDAVDYYEQLVADRRELARQLRPRYSRTMEAHLDYSAGISYYSTYQHGGQTFTGVFVATMRLDWSSQSGPLLGMGFTKDRIVVLNPAGEVQAIFGDGETLVLPA